MNLHSQRYEEITHSLFASLVSSAILLSRSAFQVLTNLFQGKGSMKAVIQKNCNFHDFNVEDI